jgi:hypothetical protein
MPAEGSPEKTRAAGIKIIGAKRATYYGIGLCAKWNEKWLVATWPI